ncbi:hypothetical protein A3I99_04855 [Candidatus Kaiserbacteria bacterium RIFCSPLOWO2_02_FULL_45_11b]|uniref:Copper resistance protein D domain-containing protein n=1 Tax=Candidatus Kaiserbacteria bacterium RIFCSPLOWO2_12_FULL_45_26 TaxID=1798525 RepID=A0A1F6FGX7_9BACT|nr:MAG: hypothetical protein A2Z56_01100 [Candidatus Kaiserbacteria bacterium RIFCSPHIGHO2_12_45_16]OGG70664.1 MAG: hypothetical protein A2929_03225 [Candidatus Kaiserbacteria bacterium RIFCSPLOWO2_01_FULL_45_25]OGG81505.1 MAG: hypothetical protein A3I99_04855 [Candidatus Kaiserbacteria bacterium RIFCSPLOWO2_02_FULL_45_11b]OGG85096.1 MAG: hypothetical protein A3G90_03480 [Candidatus Kaiserbacteria bacterium RIFCSPLOWO2_12_FULL_45_26]
MNLLFWGLTVGVIGKILVAIGIIKVHHIMALERSIDAKVIRSFAFEKTLTYLGIIFIVVGYLMELYFYGAITMLTCHGTDCIQTASAVLSQ